MPIFHCSTKSVLHTCWNGRRSIFQFMYVFFEIHTYRIWRVPSMYPSQMTLTSENVNWPFFFYQIRPHLIPLSLRSFAHQIPQDGMSEMSCSRLGGSRLCQVVHVSDSRWLLCYVGFAFRNLNNRHRTLFKLAMPVSLHSILDTNLQHHSYLWLCMEITTAQFRDLVSSPSSPVVVFNDVMISVSLL